jgi:hypothetical protein
MIVVLNLSIIIVFKVLYRYRDRTEEPEFIEKYETLTTGLNTDSIIGHYWNVIVLSRWSITSIILVFLRNHPEYQILTLYMISVFIQILIIKGRPMQDSTENKLLMFNEIMVSIYLYILLLLTDFDYQDITKVH